MSLLAGVCKQVVRPQAVMGLRQAAQLHTARKVQAAADEIAPKGILHSHSLYSLTSYAMLGSCAAGVAGFNPGNAVDYALAVVLPLHSHMGMSQVIIDYVPNPGKYKAAMGLLSVVTLATAGSLAYLTAHDHGIVSAVGLLWEKDRK